MLRLITRSSGPVCAASHSPAARWLPWSLGCHQPPGPEKPCTVDSTSSAVAAEAVTRRQRAADGPGDGHLAAEAPSGSLTLPRAPTARAPTFHLDSATVHRPERRRSRPRTRVGPHDTRARLLGHNEHRVRNAPTAVPAVPAVPTVPAAGDRTVSDGASPPADAGSEQPQPPGRSRRRAMALTALVGAAIGLTCVAFVVDRMTSQWAEVRDEVADASLGWIVLAVVLAAAGMTWIAACWRLALSLSGPAPDLRRTIAWYYGGEIGKYVPGGVWPVLGRGELARRGGVPRGRAYPSVALSLVTLYLAALGVASVLVPLDLAKQSESPAALALLALLPLGLAALHPRMLTWGRDHVARLTGRGGDIVVPPCGIAATLSWTAGFVAVPVPAGAGVREAVFLAASGLPAGLGATVAIGSRLAFLVVDVAGAALTSPLHGRGRAPQPAAADEGEPATL